MSFACEDSICRLADRHAGRAARSRLRGACLVPALSPVPPTNDPGREVKPSICRRSLSLSLRRSWLSVLPARTACGEESGRYDYGSVLPALLAALGGARRSARSAAVVERDFGREPKLHLSWLPPPDPDAHAEGAAYRRRFRALVAPSNPPQTGSLRQAIGGKADP
jgi:hypothetical protein